MDDYNYWRINFSNVCMVELEVFGFYDNFCKMVLMSGFVSVSSFYIGFGFSLLCKVGVIVGGRYYSCVVEEFGEKVLVLRELVDMDIFCIGGERILINLRIVVWRWGFYFV